MYGDFRDLNDYSIDFIKDDLLSNLNHWSYYSDSLAESFYRRFDHNEYGIDFFEYEDSDVFVVAYSKVDDTSTIDCSRMIIHEYGLVISSDQNLEDFIIEILFGAFK